jgi:hypothetical protein
MDRKLLFYVIIILQLLLPQSFSQQDLNPEQIYEKVNNAVVIVLAYNEDNKLMNQGSGVVVTDKGIIITNYHVMKNASKVNIMHGDMVIKNVKIVGGNEENDVLFLLIKNDSLSVIETPDSLDVRIGQKIYAIGSPLGYENSISEGIVSGYRKFDTINLIQITASISPGSSGGAVVNSKGQLIGISTYTVTKGQNINFAIPVKEIFKTKISPFKPSITATNEEKDEDDEVKEIEEPIIERKDIYYNPKAVNLLNEGKRVLDQYNEKNSNPILNRAIEYFEEAIRIDSNLVEAYYLAGKYQASTSYLYDYNKAKKYLSKVENYLNNTNRDFLNYESNREILLEIATFYSTYSHLEGDYNEELALKTINIFKKALKQPLKIDKNNPFYEFINDDYILYRIATSYNLLANTLIYRSIYDKNEKYFEATEYSNYALEYLSKVSSTFFNNNLDIVKEYEDIIKNKKLGEFLRFNDWELFYSNIKGKAGLLISPNNFLFVYHKKSLVKEKNNIVRLWVKEVNLNDINNGAFTYEYSKSLYEFDLVNNRYRILQYVSYYDNQVIDSQNYSDAKWQYISPDTVLETMIENIKLIMK